jgi:sulfur carrier protein
MRVQVNGKAQDLPEDATISKLLDQFHVKTDGTAVEVNRTIVPRARYAETPLKEGDAVEIVTFVGGG